MKLSAPFTALALLTSSAFGFEVITFKDDNCGGESKTINVYDNTCRNSNILSRTRSFQVQSYGGKSQRAAFYTDTSCYPTNWWIDFWADGGSDQFLKGRCINIGHDIHAFGSRAA
ncbi:hypothetical protein DPSP01_004947 [Paraphaeosphaeria sporulosa]|uniref:Uncharacterized protein n=1 Tax=Paraphaeosphaeria sporulosa TaxID=1460663 RepID=A0A177C821_9PLEO|nr:uncharacterized protein CC84DRAFT_965544 [Paraphaeosphaeria sporulosa]OAG03281.1 hypothetical protein CC84DRAFT_965544 [Paraphaeosphaeria sporulosa]